MKWKAVDAAGTRLAAKHADEITKALAKTVDPDQIIEAFLQTFGNGATLTTQQARDWVQTHAVVNSEPLVPVLNRMYAESYKLGLDASYQAYGLQQVKKDAIQDAINAALSIDWSNWKPGNAAASLLTKPKGALAALLRRTNATIAGMNKTTLDRLGTVLGDAFSVGSASRDVARSILEAQLKIGIGKVLTDSARAYVIARTEISRGLNVAANDNYKELGVEEVEWLALEECEICAENADSDPVPVGSEFPSGDTEPPAHPNCRCTIAPVIGGFQDATFTDGFINLMVKGVPGPVDIARAINRLAILPNPADPILDEPEKYVESPWRTIPAPTVDPNVWDNATIEVVALDELVGTDPFLGRKRVKKHIEAMGQALTPNRSLALILETKDQQIILDGHHRLMAWWLLGQNEAPVWKVKL
jgi:hypothetical protein